MSEEKKYALYEKQGRIGVITLNRPERLNAYTAQGILELHDLWYEIDKDPDVWAIVVKANGRAFCAGHDVRSEDPFPEPPSLHYGGIEIYKPIIAAVHGYCLGGGASMALACDIRICSEDAQFGYPQVTYGIMSMGGHQRLPRMTFHGMAVHYMLTGDLFGAQEALRLGLVSKVVPNDQLVAEAMAFAEKLAKNAPLSVRATKEALMRGREVNLQEGLHIAKMISRRLRQSEDAQEGLRSFAEKRSAVWKAR